MSQRLEIPHVFHWVDGGGQNHHLLVILQRHKDHMRMCGVGGKPSRGRKGLKCQRSTTTLQGPWLRGSLWRFFSLTHVDLRQTLQRAAPCRDTLLLLA